MKVNVHAVNFNVDRKLVDHIEERMNKLEKYYDKIVSSDVFLKVEQTSEKEKAPFLAEPSQVQEKA